MREACWRHDAGVDVGGGVVKIYRLRFNLNAMASHAITKALVK